MAAMDPLDVLMMTAEELSNPMHITALLIVAPPADAGPRFADEFYRACRAVTAADLDPRLRRRPHRGVDTGGVWVWRDVDDIDMNGHVHRWSLPADADGDALWSLVGELHAAPLDWSRPMWEAHLIDGLDGGRVALLMKVHHSVVDGIAGIRLIESWLTEDPSRRSMRLFSAEPRDADAHEDAPVQAGTSRGLPNPFAWARSTVGAAVSGADFALKVAQSQVDNVVQALIGNSAALPFSAPRTRFNGRLDAGRSVACAGVERSRICAVSEATETTRNDVITAVIAGALRAWLSAHDEMPDESLVAICPITVRARDDNGGGANAFGVALCALGTDVEDPAERLAVVARSMSEAKQRVSGFGSGPSLLVALPAIAPTLLLPQIPFVPTPRPAFNLGISNVPGPRNELYWNGAHVEAIYPVSTIYDGLGLNITVCSYSDRFDIGYVAGRDQMPDIAALIEFTERSLSELEDAVLIAS
ncbi:wax ester/triacylglycerol synthase family O-acyltransferase [Rhodococcus chondri]|uniref:Diacylglycerol O-acyltransferase n=1 Tax=Rhodococcus chondri TaxID=3065941 RepID=A0ABU7JQG2_9NOCA|nr:wax ester/triacylglycerol synthase family O-acyltransferase [Rhodococcus sp. CC-R104]MEE2032002.1 wax ester/triacylglycerol synthase family O-acyltransferase [Rhodococcus sp. CC-R104]